jgi:hypothetical protein
MELCPSFMALSFTSPISTVRVLVPVIGGEPLSVIAMGIMYIFCSSLSNVISALRSSPRTVNKQPA